MPASLRAAESDASAGPEAASVPARLRPIAQLVMHPARYQKLAARLGRQIALPLDRRAWGCNDTGRCAQLVEHACIHHHGTAAERAGLRMGAGNGEQETGGGKAGAGCG